MRTFIEGMNYNIWEVFKNDYLVPHIKLMMFWKTNIDKFYQRKKGKSVAQLKEKTIITIILSTNEFMCVSHYEETKEV